MVASNLPQLPPSERDLEVYRVVVIEGQSTRAAAQQFGLSQTRIVQIRDRAAEWIATELPPTPKNSPAQRLRLAQHTAMERLDFLYSQALESWRQSHCRQTIERSGANGITTSTRDSFGDGRYLGHAARIIELAARLPLKLAAEAGKGDREQGMEEGEREAEIGEQSLQIENPPAGDCSTTAQDESPMPAASVEVVAPTNGHAATSVEIERRRAEFLAALANDNSPVQPPITDANGMQLDEPGGDEESAGPSLLPIGERCLERSQPAAIACQGPLTRKERRARARMRRRMLKAR
jgi:hypothetical protein